MGRRQVVGLAPHTQRQRKRRRRGAIKGWPASNASQPATSFQCFKETKPVSILIPASRESLEVLNPRPCTPVFITRTCKGGYDPPRVSKLSIAELSEKKKQRIALDKYSRLVARFLILG